MFKKINFGTVAPSFLIIGVQKGGTSSLYFYLSQHPSLLVPKTKELHFFDSKGPAPKKTYLKLFPKSYGTKKQSFEATPRYIYYPGTARKIYNFNPNIKFIVMLRNPVDRAYSAWNMYREFEENKVHLKNFIKREKKDANDAIYSSLYKNGFPTFETWIKEELNPGFSKEIIEPSIIRRGYYKEQLEVYFNFFPLESFLFLNFESFKYSPISNLEKISNFLNIATFKNIPLDLEPKNKRNYTKKIDPETYKQLEVHYKEKNKGLEKLINIPLSWLS